MEGSGSEMGFGKESTGGATESSPMESSTGSWCSAGCQSSREPHGSFYMNVTTAISKTGMV